VVVLGIYANRHVRAVAQDGLSAREGVAMPQLATPRDVFERLVWTDRLTAIERTRAGKRYDAGAWSGAARHRHGPGHREISGSERDLQLGNASGSA
jgi:hypothetical protein